MRFVFAAAAMALGLAGALAPAQADTASALACDTKKLGAKDLADCLRLASDKSERELAAAFEAVGKGIDARAGLQGGQKARWKRSLNDAQALWLRYRDADCQDVAPFEQGIGKTGGDTRLTCIIDQNDRRISEIKARYP
jgi:uncharacterized protein YecT (DUF1311 family)